VIGQGYGMLGATDLESIYLGSLYFPFLPSNEWMEAYNFETSDFPKAQTLVDHLQFEAHYLNDLLANFRIKVKGVHDHSSIESRLKSAYLQTFG
jgi:hypothetical protein